MAHRPIDFYFEFSSPYGYLAGTKIDALAARQGRTVAWHPILLGAVFKVTGGQPLLQIPVKGPYILHDLPRMARLFEVPFQPDLSRFPLRSLAAARACLWLEYDDPELAARLAKTLLAAFWGAGRDIAEAASVAEIARPLGIEPAALLAAVEDPDVKQRLKEQTEAAIARGVFGSPMIFVDDEPFWGADRLDQVDLWLARGGW
jgi:2-hydroxychromene-2-carboxylate isomerase